MATKADVLQAVTAAREAHERVPAVLRRLMRYFDVTDSQIADALGVKRQTVNGWANGRTKIPAHMEAGIAAAFGLPREVIYLTPDDVIRWVLDHPSDLLFSGKGWNPVLAGLRRAS